MQFRLHVTEHGAGLEAELEEKLAKQKAEASRFKIEAADQERQLTDGHTGIAKSTTETNRLKNHQSPRPQGSTPWADPQATLTDRAGFR